VINKNHYNIPFIHSTMDHQIDTLKKTYEIFQKDMESCCADYEQVYKNGCDALEKGYMARCASLKQKLREIQSNLEKLEQEKKRVEIEIESGNCIPFFKR